MRSPTPLKAYIDAYLAVIPQGTDAIKEMDEVVRALDSIKALRSFVGDRSIDAGERRKALDVALPACSNEGKNMILLIANAGRMKDLRRIPELARTIGAGRTAKHHAVVTSATPLTAGELTRAASAIERIARMPVTLEERMDETLIAGFHVSVGDWTFDASLKGKLNRLSHALTL